MSEINEYKGALATEAFYGGSWIPLNDDGKCIIYKDGPNLCVENDTPESWRALWTARFGGQYVPDVQQMQRRCAQFEDFNRTLKVKEKVVEADMFLVGLISAVILFLLWLGERDHGKAVDRQELERGELENRKLRVEADKAVMDAIHPKGSRLFCDSKLVMECLEPNAAQVTLVDPKDNTYKFGCGVETVQMVCGGLGVYNEVR